MTQRHYSEAISRELTRRYEQMRQRAQLLAEQNRDKVYHNHPELRELRNRLQSAQWARTKQRCLSMVDNKLAPHFGAGRSIESGGVDA